MKQLDGFRRPRPDSPNLDWRNLAFRGFADYMKTWEFVAAIDDLITIAKVGTMAIMCAEVLPWRCHRALITDALVVRGVDVQHIISLTSRRKHSLTQWARIENMQITYPKELA
jgi:uncharacterized protein (DUF488 family)